MSFNNFFLYLQNFCDTAEALAWLELYPQRALTLYGHLILAVQAELAPMQSAFLLLGCQPFVPDIVLFCKVLLGDGDDSGRGTGQIEGASNPLAFLP